MTFSRKLAGLALLAASCALPAFAQAQTTLTIGIQQEPPSLDPTSDASASIDGMLSHNVYECLTSVQQDGTVVPDLATSWTVSPDGLTYTFNLAKGVTFHDGTAFDANDVKFSFDRAMAADSTNPSKGIFKPIESVTVVDPATVRIKLKQQDAFFLFNIAQGDASIVAPESAEGDKTHPIGTGPFVFDHMTRGQELVLTKNPNYRDAASVSVDRVAFDFISDPSTAANALLSGQIDAFPGFPSPELLDQFKADPRFKVAVGSTQGEVILAMNNSRAPFTDLRVRRAISYALDRQEIIDGAMYGMATPIGSFFPPSDKAYVDLTGRYPHDDAKARALLNEAGIAKGTTLSLRVPPFSYATRSAEIIQAELAKVGLDVKVEQVEWSFWLDRIYKNRDYDMTIIAHTSPNDLGNFARGKDYFYGYQNDAFDTLWHRIETEVDPEKRMALQQQAQRLLAEEAVHGFLFELPKLGVYKVGVNGFWKDAPVIFQPLAGVTKTN